MMFAEHYRPDDQGHLVPPGLIAEFVSSAGRYERGLFSVLDASSSDAVLESWRWLLGTDAVAIVASSVGDLFFWSERHGAVYFLNVQRGSATFVDKDLAYFFDHFLTEKEIFEGVLHLDLFRSLIDRLGEPTYQQCYIAEPWQRVGGSGDLTTYVKGNLIVYVSLLGQAVQVAMSQERANLK